VVTLLSQGLVLAQNICTFRKQQIGNRKLGNKQENIYVINIGRSDRIPENSPLLTIISFHKTPIQVWITWLSALSS